jgi:hypothetical protein
VKTFLLAFEPFVADMMPDPTGELPPAGVTDLRALTTEGRFTARALTEDFGTGKHPMSGVFHAGQALIAALRAAADAPRP